VQDADRLITTLRASDQYVTGAEFISREVRTLVVIKTVFERLGEKQSGNWMPLITLQRDFQVLSL